MLHRLHVKDLVEGKHAVFADHNLIVRLVSPHADALPITHLKAEKRSRLNSHAHGASLAVIDVSEEAVRHWLAAEMLLLVALLGLLHVS